MKRYEKTKKWIVFGLVTTACIFGAVGLYAMKPQEPLRQNDSAPLKQVSFVTASPGAYPAQINAFGEVAPKWTTTLRAQVGGRIIRINEDLKPGKHLAPGDLLLEIDPTDYQTALAEARLALENARVDLIQTERRAARARADWKAAGIGQQPASPLVFHTPQLKAARARVAYARQNVAKAEKDLARTRITSPYKGLVTQRFADKGEVLFSGDQVATLISAESLEIGVGLDQAQISRLGRWEKARATLIDPATDRSWQGRLVRSGGCVDPKTRLSQFFIGVADPEKTLLPGMFVTAVITGSTRNRLLDLPESALTREGDIWLIDREDRLRRLPVRPSFYDSGRIFVPSASAEASAAEPGRIRVAAMPAPGFIAGTQVLPTPVQRPNKER